VDTLPDSMYWEKTLFIFIGQMERKRENFGEGGERAQRKGERGVEVHHEEEKTQKLSHSWLRGGK